MKFSLERDTFARILKRIDSVCSNRGSFAILNSCMIEARDHSIVVTGTDLDITLRTVENADIIEEGAILINARRLLDTVQNQVPGCSIFMTSEGSQVLVEAGNFRARIPTSDIAEFPQIADIEAKTTLSMDALEFKDLIDKTYFSISKDDSRADFTGAFLTISENGHIQMVSTDGHRLSRAESLITINGQLPKTFVSGVIVPRKGLAELAKNLTDGNINIDTANNKFIVSIGSTIFHINLIAGQFPDFSKVIPSQLDHKAIIKREDFQQILKRASIFTAKAGTIRLTMSMGKLDISTFDAKSGEMRDFVQAEYEGSGVTAGFNWRYIDEILSVINNDYVSLEVIDMDSPAVIRDISTDNYDFIVMPMQL
ncbi:MAG: DNA polymerase III subunit beta [Proteobacteria bacterium]|nr:DNA polymerase III subunit beta [Pseudomonadota bacterium]